MVSGENDLEVCRIQYLRFKPVRAMVISKTIIIDLKLFVWLKDAVLRAAHEQICNSKCVVP